MFEISTARRSPKRAWWRFLVNDFTLDVHHVIIFQQPFPDAEVVLFDFFLRPFDGFGDHRVLDHFAFFQSQPVHDPGDPVGAEHTHQVVFKGNKEL